MIPNIPPIFIKTGGFFCKIIKRNNMKYLLILTLLLSTNALAQDFDPNLLVGKWECEGTTTDLNYQSNNKGFVDFKANGTYIDKSILNNIIDNQPLQTKIKYFGYWKISQNTLSLNTETIFDYISSNPKLDKVYGLEAFLRNDKSFYNFQIIELSDNILKYDFTDDGLTGNYECKRTNKKLVF